MNIFLTLGRHRGLFRRWLIFAGGLMPGGKLPRRDTELVILRIAHLTGCDYEWAHHQRLGRRTGLSSEQLARVPEGSGDPGWTPHEALLLRAAEELHEEGVAGDELWAALSAEFSERERIELLMLIGHYEMIAMTLKSLGVQVEPSLAAATPTLARR